MPAEVVPQLLGAEKGSDAPIKKAEIGTAAQGILNVCILTADFLGLKACGGTATAYHLLAAVLAKEERLNVSLTDISGWLHNLQKLMDIL